jgi:hypothetical protein
MASEGIERVFFSSKVMDRIEDDLANPGDTLYVSRVDTTTFQASMKDKTAQGGTPFSAMANLFYHKSTGKPSTLDDLI